jgi:hypothetical protein
MSSQKIITLHRCHKPARRLEITLVTLGLAAGSLIGLGSAASAQTVPANVARAGRVPLTAAQTACLTSNGFPAKAKPGPTATTPAAAMSKVKKTAAERDAQRIAKDAAKATCGIPAGKLGGKRHKGGREADKATTAGVGIEAKGPAAGKSHKHAGGKKHANSKPKA